MQVPSNLFLNKVGKPAIYLPLCMIIWGTISAATAACQNFGGLVAIRFMLGFVEAAYFVSPTPFYIGQLHSKFILAWMPLLFVMLVYP